MTIPEAIEAMRRNVGTPGEALSMAAFADVWDEAEGPVECEAIGPYRHDRCSGGRIRSYNPAFTADCRTCNGDGYVSNGNSLRAEALRLLAECGKVGKENGYWPYPQSKNAQAKIPLHWWTAARSHGLFVGCECIGNRIALMDAYAAADQPTRERWARETRALVPGVTTDAECEYCVRGVVVGNETWDHYCNHCQGTGRVPAQKEVTT